MSFLGATQQPGQLLLAVVATVSVILPLPVLLPLGQRRIAGGLADRAVKG